MKLNRFKELLAQGKTPIGHMLIEFHTRGMAQILEVAGVDFAVMDMEHGSFTIGDVADMVAWLKATRVAPFVRIPQVQYHFVARALDAGVLGIVAPNVQTAGEARALMDAAKYPPLGKRGFCFGGANSDFRFGDPGEYVEYSNKNTAVICMIESPQGVDNVEGIAATAGVDALWVGHWDLTQYMGILGEFDDGRFLDAVKRVIGAARRHGLPAIIQPGNITELRRLAEMGFNVFSWNGDFYVYKQALVQAIGDVRQVIGE